MARMTTLPLWRTMSRTASLPPGSIKRSRSTRKSGPSKTTSELSIWAVSAAAGWCAWAVFFTLGRVVAFTLEFTAFAALAGAAFFALGWAVLAFLGVTAFTAFFVLGIASLSLKRNRNAIRVHARCR